MWPFKRSFRCRLSLIFLLSSPVPDVRLTARHFNSRQPETCIFTFHSTEKAFDTRASDKPALFGGAHIDPGT